MTARTRRQPTRARTLQTRLARAEAVRRDALDAWHTSQCQRLGLPQTATEDQITREFARRMADVIHRYERTHGPLPPMRPATGEDDLAAMDDGTFLARCKATLLQDGFLAYDNTPGDTP